MCCGDAVRCGGDAMHCGGDMVCCGGDTVRPYIVLSLFSICFFMSN